jgi:hypothetical protein
LNSRSNGRRGPPGKQDHRVVFHIRGVSDMISKTGTIFTAFTLALAFSVTSSAQAANSGGCYDLEVIAQKTKIVSSNDNNGHRIFINMNGTTKIMLQEGAFGVIDYNGTDGSASFSLPNPDPTNSGVTSYSVFARMVGKPGSTLKSTTCAYDPLLATDICSVNSLDMKRITGTSKFQNVSADMLYIYADINGDGIIDRVPLFDSSLTNYYWNIDSTGRAHAQLRFCPVSTAVL